MRVDLPQVVHVGAVFLHHLGENSLSSDFLWGRSLGLQSKPHVRPQVFILGLYASGTAESYNTYLVRGKKTTAVCLIAVVF